MAQNWRNYAAYYVMPYIGKRAIQDIDGAVCDALYAKLLTEGRVKARPAPSKLAGVPVHTRRVAPDGRVLECRPYRYDNLRCYRRHDSDDPALRQPIEAKKRPRQAIRADRAKKVRPGLDPKTVVNTHRMLHRAWRDFVARGWVKRNVVNDAHPPRVVRKSRKIWTVAQLRTFLQRARPDRFFALWVLAATSGMRRCELADARRDLLDLDAGTLTTEVTRVVVDGKVIESDGKTANAQHVIALDPFTLAALKVHTELLDAERVEFGPDYSDHGLLFCWENGAPPITRRFHKLSVAAGLPKINLTMSATPTRPRAATRRSTGRRLASGSATRTSPSP
jgi:integrase